MKLERFEEAVTAFDRSLASSPGDSNIWAEKGRALAKLERFEEAVTAFDRSIADDPLYADSWNMKGGALRRLGREAEARMAEAWAEALETL